MKRILVFLLAMAMVFASFQCAMAEDESVITIEPGVLSSLDKSAEEWFESEVNRELFFVATLCDCIPVWSDTEESVSIEAIVLDTIYITKEPYSITANFFGLDNLLMFTYNPLLETAGYTMVQIDDASELSSLLMMSLDQDDAFDEYEKVDGEAVMILFDSLLEE